MLKLDQKGIAGQDRPIILHTASSRKWDKNKIF